MPISIWSSGRSKVGLPAAGTMHEVSAMPIVRPLALTLSATALTAGEVATLLGCGAGDLLDEHGDADTATAGGVQAVLYGDVVVGDDGLDRDPGVGGQLRGHLEVQHVAGVVLHDVQDARAAVDRGGGDEDRLGGRRGEHLTAHRRVEHAEPDEPTVQRLVARPAAGDQADLAALRRVAADDQPVLVVDAQLRVGRCHPEQRLLDDIVGGVDELLHVFHLPGVTAPALARS